MKIDGVLTPRGDVENQSPGRDDRKRQPSLRDFWWPCASIPALKCRAIFKGSFGTVFHRGSRREPALTFPPEKNERPAPTRRQPHGKFPPPREGKIGINAAARKNCSMLGTPFLVNFVLETICNFHPSAGSVFGVVLVKA